MGPMCCYGKIGNRSGELELPRWCLELLSATRPRNVVSTFHIREQLPLKQTHTKMGQVFVVSKLRLMVCVKEMAVCRSQADKLSNLG